MRTSLKEKINKIKLLILDVDGVMTNGDIILARAKAQRVPARILGEVKGDAIVMAGEAPLPLQYLRDLHEGWLPRYMDSR